MIIILIHNLHQPSTALYEMFVAHMNMITLPIFFAYII